MHTALVEMVRGRPPNPEVTDSSTWDIFVNNNIHQQRSIDISTRFNWVRDRVRQWQFLVYLMDGEHNLTDYFTNHHPNRKIKLNCSTYIVLTVDASKYACYMSPNDLWGYVESLPAQGNGWRSEIGSLLLESEIDEGRMDTNRPIRHTWYWCRQ